MNSSKEDDAISDYYNTVLLGDVYPKPVIELPEWKQKKKRENNHHIQKNRYSSFRLALGCGSVEQNNGE